MQKPEKGPKGGGISNTNTCMHKIKGLLIQSIKANSMAHILIKISQNFQYCINQSTTSYKTRERKNKL